MSSSWKNNLPIVPMSLIMVDYCRSPEELNAFVENMKNVIIYVDVRRKCITGRYISHLNASEKHIDIATIAGVRVNNTLTPDTTHIIFENGRKDTYRKAMMWNIPLVNTQWFEGCMISHSVCDPSKFPVRSLERYKNPRATIWDRRQTEDRGQEEARKE